MQEDQQVVLVTGASSGIGHAIALSLSRNGHVVYASMRETEGKNAQRVAELQQLAKREDIALRTVELYVLSETGCRTAVDAILGK